MSKQEKVNMSETKVSKITISDSVFDLNHPFIKSFQKLLNIDIEGTYFMDIETIEKAIGERQGIFEKARMKLIEKYCKRDDKQEIIVEGGQYVFTDENSILLQNDYQKLVSGSFDIINARKIPVSKKCNKLSYVDFKLLSDIICFVD